MSWSTRRLAEVAGTTVKSVRHYHAVGLLEEPGRAANGYKHYGTSHLVRLLQITRLRSLGMSLADIAEAGESDESYVEAVQSLDARLADSIARQQAVRAELADLLAHSAGRDVPAGFEGVADSLTAADRAMITISGALHDESVTRELHSIVADHQEADEDFNALAPDADEDAVDAVSAQMATVLRAIHERYPSTLEPPTAVGNREHAVRGALDQAVADLYNPAQLEVLRRAYRRSRESAEHGMHRADHD